MVKRVREAGAPPSYGQVLGHVASHKDGWLFRKSLAKLTGYSVRTVQRALTFAKTECLFGIHRAHKDEIPPGREYKDPRNPQPGEGPFEFGWSHRFVIGRGLAGAAAFAAVVAAKLARLARRALPSQSQLPRRDNISLKATVNRAARGQGRKMTAEEIESELAKRDAELAGRAREQPPPD